MNEIYFFVFNYWPSAIDSEHTLQTEKNMN